MSDQFCLFHAKNPSPKANDANKYKLKYCAKSIIG